MSISKEIPLSKLTASPANVRKTGRTDGIKELAASIRAHGLLQNLTVRKGTGETEGLYEVIAGGRRLAALQRLAKQDHIKANTKIPCKVIEGEESAEEISLAENVGQCPMHPADQYEAFAALHYDQNMPAEDIAARFGVTPAVVRQRLKLGSVSPKLIKRYRDGDMTLDELTAFTITDDHKAQERVFKAIPDYERSRETILAALTESQVPADDRRALFVGIEAYQKAGGALVRDLFDNESDGYLTDPALLDRLVREKLQRVAAKVMKEGWKWVSVDLSFDHGSAALMRRVRPKLSAEDENTLHKLLADRTDLYEAEDNGEGDDAKLEALEQQIAAFDEREQYDPADIARAGAFVALDHNGHPHIARGYLRKEDETPGPVNEDAHGAERAATEKPKGLSDKLVTELTAAKTSALRSELGNQPDTALTALTHALVLRLFYQTSDGSCLCVSAREASLQMHDPKLAEGPDEAAVAKRHAAWEKRFPDDMAKLWDVIAGLAQKERLALLAHCVGLTVDAVQDRATASPQPVTVLAQAVKLDMTKHWQPTADTYFARVSRDGIASALHEVAGTEVPHEILGMKKAAMAQAAEAFVAGKGWLPEVLRTP